MKKFVLQPRYCCMKMTNWTKKTSWRLSTCWKYITDLCKSHLRVDDFWSKFRCRRAADEFPACFTRHGQLRMRTKTKQTNSCSFSFSFMDLKLSYIIIAAGALNDGANK